MREFTSTREYELMPEVMSNQLKGVLGNYKEYPDHELGTLLGGSAFLVEKEEDLALIDTTGWLPGSPKQSILESAMQADGAEAFKEHYMFFVINNNGGGPSYWIPKVIAEKYPTVMQTIESGL